MTNPPNSARSASSSAWTFVHPASLLAVISVGHSEFYAATRPSLAAYPTPTTRSESRRQAHKARMKGRAIFEIQNAAWRRCTEGHAGESEASSKGVNFR